MVVTFRRCQSFVPAADATAWGLVVAEPISARSIAPYAEQGWRVLAGVLTPLMWRNTKTVVAQEFHLPSRSLKPTWLRFQAGERAFYDQVGAQMEPAGSSPCSVSWQHLLCAAHAAGEDGTARPGSSPADECQPCRDS